jgi:hypothetical protein
MCYSGDTQIESQQTLQDSSYLHLKMKIFELNKTEMTHELVKNVHEILKKCLKSKQIDSIKWTGVSLQNFLFIISICAKKNVKNYLVHHLMNINWTDFDVSWKHSLYTSYQVPIDERLSIAIYLFIVDPFTLQKIIIKRLGNEILCLIMPCD